MIARRILTSITLGLTAAMLWFVVSSVLSQAAPMATPTPLPLAVVELIDTPFDPGGIQWMEEQAAEFGLHFGAAILALDRDTAFLHGGLSVPAGTLRSMLLRTEDGGAHWQDSPDLDAFTTVTAPYSGRNFLTESTTADGSVWKISAEAGADVLRLSRRSPADAAEVIRAVPIYFQYNQGRIILP